ncbi:MAG: hypothetical protein HUN05_08410 [Desulfobacter sp.]|nr:MAG: hypothetical protein HUN05_02710 [Desulfobacter sp.]WDP84751.1 MAG: hypothetical protein HUN05_05990 [Desulfobacter sp.]WDP85020.1 MAG: hypothetical protein HUN05_07610 [Desulfobacter sp.]WDP85077.1 MAG: hypothetical protein HUN05_07945 [Desulfobacter sp.]WDP85156.1 MAG: hypothetical protein HUN05_08410 [Desulfobacter sp.]
MKKAEDCNTVDEVLACLKKLEEDPNRLVRNANELEQMEQEILEYTNRISAFFLKKRSRPQ